MFIWTKGEANMVGPVQQARRPTSTVAGPFGHPTQTTGHGPDRRLVATFMSAALVEETAPRAIVPRGIRGECAAASRSPPSRRLPQQTVRRRRGASNRGAKVSRQRMKLPAGHIVCRLSAELEPSMAT